MLNSKKLMRSLEWDLAIRTQRNAYAISALDIFRRHAAAPRNQFLDNWVADAGQLADIIRREGHSLTGQDASNLLFFLDCLKKVPGSKREDMVLARFVVDQAKVGKHVHLKRNWVPALRRIVLSWIGPAPEGFEDFCCNGPGATAERSKWDDKFHDLRMRPSQVDYLFKKFDPLDRLSVASRRDVPSRVIVVEKNRKGGRIIAAEQASRQFLQQGLGRLIRTSLIQAAGLRCLDDRDLHVAFLKAELGSRTTVDLKAASDFVSMPLLAAILPPGWMKAVAACRSHRLEVGASVLTTKTAALMGNGFCFAMLTLVCAAICALVTRRKRAGQCWSVFGDDIVIDDRYYYELRYVLVSAGLIVNDEKTFRPDAPFAETCGTDVWRRDLTNVRPKFLRSRVDVLLNADDLLKLCEFQRYLATRGCSQASSYVAKVVRVAGMRLTGHMPVNMHFDNHYQVGYSTLDDGYVCTVLEQAHSSARYQSLSVLDLTKVDPRRESNLDEGESWVKAFHSGSPVTYESLTRSGRWKFKRIPLIPAEF